jgi:hypothetical protein
MDSLIDYLEKHSRMINPLAITNYSTRTYFWPVRAVLRFNDYTNEGWLPPVQCPDIQAQVLLEKISAYAGLMGDKDLENLNREFFLKCAVYRYFYIGNVDDTFPEQKFNSFKDWYRHVKITRVNHPVQLNEFEKFFIAELEVMVKNDVFDPKDSRDFYPKNDGHFRLPEATNSKLRSHEWSAYATDYVVPLMLSHLVKNKPREFVTKALSVNLKADKKEKGELERDVALYFRWNRQFWSISREELFSDIVSAMLCRKDEGVEVSDIDDGFWREADKLIKDMIDTLVESGMALIPEEKSKV